MSESPGKGSGGMFSQPDSHGNEKLKGWRIFAVLRQPQFAVGSRWYWGTYGGSNFAEAVTSNGAKPASIGTSVQPIGVWGLTPGTHTSDTPKYEAAVRVAKMYTTT